MAYCGIDCATTPLTPSPEQCILAPRFTGISRIHFYNCSTSLPDPLTAEALQDLYDDGEIVVTQPLGNITINDPEFQEFQIAACMASQRIVSGREITFQDRIAVTVIEGSPALPNQFYDMDFWADKVQRTLTMNYAIEYCDGNVTLALDANGNPLSADLQVWLNEEAPSTPGGKTIQFKAGSIKFNGDPLALTNIPAYNRAPDGTITLL